ncbi:MAG TPA: hypothetical protein VFF67_10435 [Thermoplasmata archaeon]|nr:hypothetical protein [Thermoplasmata archaeon]
MEDLAPARAGGEGGRARTRRRRHRYSKRSAAHTVRAIDPPDMERIRAAARRYVPPPGWFEGIVPWQVVDLLELAGFVPEVLCHPDVWHLRAVPEDDGRLHLRFTRHKKEGGTGEMDLPVVMLDHPDARWIPALIERFRERPITRQHLGRMLAQISELAGVPFSSRSLRHTCGVRVAFESRDAASVTAWLGCSYAIATKHYLRLATSRDPRFLALSRGANGRSPSPGASPSPGGSGSL